MNEYDENLPIESLEFSPECLKALKRSGVTLVGDVLMIADWVWDKEGPKILLSSINHGVLEHLDEIERQLKAKGCWKSSWRDD